MITSIANSVLEIAAGIQGQVSTINSVSPRVFISVPITAEAFQSYPATRAAIAARTTCRGSRPRSAAA